MTRRPTTAHALAAAAAAAATDPDEAPAEVSPPASGLPAPTAQRPRGPGRPKGKREVEARLTVYLDGRRHEALRRLAGDRGRSVHSLILEGVDSVIGKPSIKAWK
jgi:hypothetical protein